jgi:hypothetical protein
MKTKTNVRAGQQDAVDESLVLIRDLGGPIPP